ncbi:MAG: Fic family protein [Boseongicola sp.]|nr:Fic family protein [Boseongicola sp.]
MKSLETPARIEPCGIEEAIPVALADLALEVRAAALELGRGLPADSVAELRTMTQILNSYYSNLIEGHNAKPADIQRALAGGRIDGDDRPLAEEAAAHVRVQAWIDGLAERDELPLPTSVEFIREVHRRFYSMVPTELRMVERHGGKMEIVPGALRGVDQEVTVGRHQPPSPGRLDAFMNLFSWRYEGLTQGATGRVLAIAWAHHRLNYIHPFLDGNGRVSRLMSHAMCHRAGIAGGGLWSISRGLARGLNDRGEYKFRMDAADGPRRGDLDGRGNLSLAALTQFTAWFFTVMLDQIQFATAVFNLVELKPRYLSLIQDLHPSAARMHRLVEHVLDFGTLSRGDARFVLGVSERAARADLSKAVAEGFLKSSTPKGPVRIAFPMRYRERLFPNLFSHEEIDAPSPPVVPNM